MLARLAHDVEGVGEFANHSDKVTVVESCLSVLRVIKRQIGFEKIDKQALEVSFFLLNEDFSDIGWLLVSMPIGRLLRIFFILLIRNEVVHDRHDQEKITIDGLF